MLVAVLLVAGAVTADAAYMHTVTLKQGMSGSQVLELQGALGVSQMTGYFGSITKAAVMAFQSSHGLTADGVVGPMTGAALAGMGGSGGYPSGCTSSSGYSTTTGMPCSGGSSSVPGCTSTSGYSPTTGEKCDGSGGGSSSGDLTGGAGSVDSYDLASGLSNEEVGEDEEDVQVAGLEVENGDDSDIDITALRLVFDEGTAGSDFEDYATEVSVWFGSEEVARLDADSFNDDNNWTKTVTLDNAVLDAGDTETLYVAVTGTKNLDTNDIADTWTVDFTSMRFTDAEGDSISEDPGVAATTFSFESFATSADMELKITEAGDENELVNDAHLINVDATNTTDDVTILAFDLELEGDSDVNIDSLPVTLTTTEAAGTDFDEPGDVVTSLYLYVDGDEIGSESVDGTAAGGADTQVVVFDDLDWDLSAGDEVHVEVKGKFVALSGALDAGDTIAAAFGETETDLATFDAEDETGEDLADGDKTGTANSTASDVRDVGFSLEFVSGTAVLSHAADLTVATDDDQGTFTITFDVTAWDGDIYLDGTSPTEAGTDAHNLDIAGAETVLASSIRSSTGATLSGTVDTTGRYKIAEDDTERFEIKVTLAPTADGYFEVSLADLLALYADADVTDAAAAVVTTGLVYTYDLVDFKTPQLFLNQN